MTPDLAWLFSGLEVAQHDTGIESDTEWQPIPLELPIDAPYRRPPTPAGGEQRPDPDSDIGTHVIVIDLC